MDTAKVQINLANKKVSCEKITLFAVIYYYKMVLFAKKHLNGKQRKALEQRPLKRFVAYM